MRVFRKNRKLVLISVILLAAMTTSAQVLQQPVQPVEPIQTIDRGTRDQLLEKTRVGVANVLSASQVSDTVNVSIVDPEGRNRNDLLFRPAPWTPETTPHITGALDNYLVNYRVRINAQKRDTILEHLENYTVFKTAIFSSLEPSEELGQVIAGQA